MWRRFAGVVGCVVTLLGHACSEPEHEFSAPVPEAVDLRATGAMVRVGSTTMSSIAVRHVVQSRRLPPAEAGDVVMRELLWTEAAAQVGARNDPVVKARIDAALAHRLVQSVAEEARARGPYDDREIAEALAIHWLELDRPETRQVVHALVKHSVPDAASVAEALRGWLETRVIGTDALARESSFRAAASAFAGAPEAPTIELVGPFTRQGILANGGSLEPTFAEAAFEVEEGKVSRLVRTSYGFHVICVLSVRAPYRATKEQQLAVLTPELLARRAGPQWQALIERLRRGRSVRVFLSDAQLSAIGKVPERDVRELKGSSP